MQNSSCVNVTPSLDDVVQQALHARHRDNSNKKNDGSGDYVSASPPSPGAAVASRSLLSQLSDPQNPLATELARAPTIQGLHKLCHAFVERYHTPDALLLDTAWWTGETARMRHCSLSNVHFQSKLLPSTTLTSAEREELLRRTAQLLRATHHISTPVELHSTTATINTATTSFSGNLALHGRTRHLPTTSSNTTPHVAGLLPAHPLHPEDGGEAGVLCFDDSTVLPNEQEGNWASLELDGDKELQRSSELHGRIRKEEECLRVLEAWILHAAATDAEGSEAKSEGKGNTNEEVDALCEESLAYVLHHRPELVTRHEELFEVLHLIALSICNNPSEKWTATAFTLFQALPPRAQLDFLHHLLASFAESVPRGEKKDLALLTFVHHVLCEFPENWLSLLDAEVTDVFLGVVAFVVIPFAAVLDVVDPTAGWLVQWCTRPSLLLATRALAQEHAEILEGLCTAAKFQSSLPSSHATCVLLHVLPHLCRLSVNDAATASSVPARRKDSKKDAQETPWVALFQDLQQSLSANYARFNSAVYELANCSLCSCAVHLPWSAREVCVANLVQTLQQWLAHGYEDKAAAAAAAAARLSMPLVFSFQLLTELLYKRGREETQFSATLWELLDGPLREQMQAAVTAISACAAALVHTDQNSDAKPAETTLPFASNDVLTSLQQCWERLLCCHTDRLPHTLAAVMEDVVAVSRTDTSRDTNTPYTRLFTWRTLIALSATVQGWSALRPHLRQLSATLSSTSSNSTNAAASVSTDKPWAAPLLQALLRFSDSTALPLVAASSSTRGPLSGQKPAKSKSPRASLYEHVHFFSPNCVALLQRWSTDAAAHAGLLAAAHAAALYFLHCIQGKRRAETGTSNEMRPLLLWPVEAYPDAGNSKLSHGEDSAASSLNARSLACYQSLVLWLACTALPSTSTAADARSGCASHADEALDALWQQLEDLWLTPAELLQKEKATTGEPPASSAVSPAAFTTGPPAAANLRNFLPFEEESLLCLLCALALCLLVRPSAEYAAWLSRDVVMRRLHPLRRLSVARRGVDPVYFMVRYITSGKGRRRLPAILLDGCAAELTVDTVVDVRDFTEGEDLPAGEVAQAVDEGAVTELLQAAFPLLYPSALQESTQLVTRSRTPEASAKCSTERTSSMWSHRLATLARTLLGHQNVLRTTPIALQQLLALRTPEEWDCFMNYNERAISVSKLIEIDYPAVATALRTAHVDVVYLALLCVSSWLRLPVTHVTPARRKLAWAALLYFAHNGVSAYDDFVVRSLAAQVERLQRESELSVEEAVLFPQSRALPVPSLLFALLLVKPFVLATS